MPARVVEPNHDLVLAQLPLAIPKIFDQVQNSIANHQKNFVALYKIHTEAAQVTETVKNGKAVRLTGERKFEDEFQKMLLCVLAQKKSAAQAERVIKFVAGYTRFVNEKASEEKAEGEDEDDDETLAARFTEHLLKFLLKGFEAKEKPVRYKVLHLVAEMVSHLGEIEEELYIELRSKLLDRVNDKESSVRVQALIALSKLSGAEEDEGEVSVVDVLHELLTYDSAAEVRRAALLNIPVTPTSLPHILERTRDTDTITRKLVYHSVLEPNVLHNEQMGATHPRRLSIAQRELIVKNGLGDREPSVRAAAASLIGAWVDAVMEATVEEESVAEAIIKDEEGEDKKPDVDGEKEGAKKKMVIETGVLGLLGLFDLEQASASVAANALLSVFTTRVDIFENIEFSAQYWGNLTPERAFLARVFVDHCIATKAEGRLESVLPVVTSLAFRIQNAYNTLITNTSAFREEKIVRDFTDEEIAQKEEERMDGEFVLGELLALAVNLDYSDEIGRRKMFQLIRDMLSKDTLPESLVTRCLDVLRELATNERDLIRIVVEVILELRDFGDDDEEPAPRQEGDIPETPYPETPAPDRHGHTTVFNAKKKEKSREEMTPEERARRDSVDLKCLTLTIATLERVNGTMEENSSLDGIVDDLIGPSLSRPEIDFREKGFTAMGLCCLIARNLAVKNIEYIVATIKGRFGALKLIAMKILFDILMAHDAVLLRKEAALVAKVTENLKGFLESEGDSEALALLCVGTAKLIVSGMITDIEVIKKLIKLYLIPSTAENQGLRQCLTFFFPVYSYSSPLNQKRIQEVFIPMYLELKRIRGELDEDEEMIGAAQIATMFMDWTDPLKLSKAAESVKLEGSVAPESESVHVDLAMDIVQEMLKNTLQKDDKKVLCQLLNKLHLPDSVDDDKIRRLRLLIYKLRTNRPIQDTTTNNAFTKFETAVLKKYEKQLEDFSEEEYRKLESLQELFDFVDSIIPLDDDEAIELEQPKKRGKKRRSESVETTEEETDRERSLTPAPRKGKSKAKRRRLSASGDETDTGGSGQGAAPAPTASRAPTRTLPKRSAASKKPIVDVIETSDNDDDVESTPKALQRRAPAKPALKLEPASDDDEHGASGASGGGIEPDDSLISDESDEEEEKEEEGGEEEAKEGEGEKSGAARQPTSRHKSLDSIMDDDDEDESEEEVVTGLLVED